LISIEPREFGDPWEVPLALIVQGQSYTDLAQVLPAAGQTSLLARLWHAQKQQKHHEHNQHKNDDDFNQAQADRAAICPSFASTCCCRSHRP
jgi:hypothetical protein